MYKIGFVGERDSVIGFLALGFDVREAADAAAAEKEVESLAGDKNCAVIFLVENYAEALPTLLAKYKDSPLPAIIPVPGRAGATGFGTAVLREAVERAVGVDLFKD